MLLRKWPIPVALFSLLISVTACDSGLSTSGASQEAQQTRASEDSDKLLNVPKPDVSLTPQGGLNDIYTIASDDGFEQVDISISVTNLNETARVAAFFCPDGSECVDTSDPDRLFPNFFDATPDWPSDLWSLGYYFMLPEFSIGPYQLPSNDPIILCQSSAISFPPSTPEDALPDYFACPNSLGSGIPDPFEGLPNPPESDDLGYDPLDQLASINETITTPGYGTHTVGVHARNYNSTYIQNTDNEETTIYVREPGIEAYEIGQTFEPGATRTFQADVYMPPGVGGSIRWYRGNPLTNGETFTGDTDYQYSDTFNETGSLRVEFIRNDTGQTYSSSIQVYVNPDDCGTGGATRCLGTGPGGGGL